MAPPGAILQGTFQGQHPAAQGPAALARLAPQASAMAQAHSQNAMFAPNAGHLAQRPIIGKPMQHVFVMNGHPGFLVPVNAMPSGAAMGHHHVILHPQQVPNTHLRTYVQQGYGVQPNSGQPQLQYASGFVGRVPQQMGQGQVAMPGQMMAQAQWAHQQQLGQMGLPQYGMQAQATPQGTAGYLAMPNGLQGAGGRGSVLPTTFKPTMPFHPNMAPQVLAFPGPQPRAKPYDTNQYTNMGADKDAGREQWAKARKVVGTQGGREDVPREGLPPRPSLSPSTPRLLPLHMLAAAAMEVGESCVHDTHTYTQTHTCRGLRPCTSWHLCLHARMGTPRHACICWDPACLARCPCASMLHAYPMYATSCVCVTQYSSCFPACRAHHGPCLTPRTQTHGQNSTSCCNHDTQA